MKKRILYTMMCVLLAFALSSCEQKDLCYHHPHTVTVKIEFDWKNAPEADPDGMCVFFYPSEGGNPQRFDFRGKTGGQIDIQVGTYRILCYNNDTGAILFRGTDRFDTHEGFTRKGDIFESIYGSLTSKAPQANDAKNEQTVICPDMMWGCNMSNLYILGEGNTETENTKQIITLCPDEMICTYTYEIRNIKNLEHVTQICGSLSGMAPSMFFGIEELGKECVTLPIEAVSDGVSTITGKSHTFGHHPTNTTPHRMLLYVWMDDGKKYYYGSEGDKFDVTKQIDNAPDKHHVHIIIDGLDLPQPIEDDTGFNPSVDEWTDAEEDIII